MVAWALAHMQHPHDDFFRAAMRDFLRRPAEYDANSLTNMLWAFATLRYEVAFSDASPTPSVRRPSSRFVFLHSSIPFSPFVAVVGTACLLSAACPACLLFAWLLWIYCACRLLPWACLVLGHGNS